VLPGVEICYFQITKVLGRNLSLLNFHENTMSVLTHSLLLLLSLTINMILLFAALDSHHPVVINFDLLKVQL
jgi:hypothetical protein